MNIVQLQTSGKSAGSAAVKLHRAFLKKGLNAHLISLYRADSLDSNIISLPRIARLVSDIEQRIKKVLFFRKIVSRFGSFSYPIIGNDITKLDVVKNADVIYLHWILGGFLNLKNIENILKLKKPVFVVMHDMWWITGGCHHSFECKKYQVQCYNCHIFQREKKKDLSYKLFKKKKFLNKKFDNLYYISPSHWLYSCAEKSAILNEKPLYVIPNIIETKNYKKLDKLISKKILNFSVDDIIITFGAISINSPYKGWKYFLDSLNKLNETKGLQHQKIKILLFGSGYPQDIQKQIPFPLKLMGAILDEVTLALIYNSSNVFVVPSLADNLPTTIAESLNCGTPVVGFNIGGIPEMIEHKQNGYLAKYKNSEDLAKGIIYCLENNLQGRISDSFEGYKIINKHLNLINEKVSKHSLISA